MLLGIIRRLTLVIAIGMSVQFASPSPVNSAPEYPLQVKELNFVFVHGAGGYSCALQLLADSIEEQLPTYALEYEEANADTKILVNTLNRCYPNNVDIDVWANNIADSIDKHLHDKKNIILIGHSMGGKTALRAVARNIGNLADKVSMVVTINSPVESLYKYFAVGGGSVLDYCRADWMLSDQGVCNSLAYYDSSPDGQWVATNKHWLAFVSSETAPLSEQFEFGGIDGWPRNMDDSLVPISAQYSEEADVIYYGEHGHSDFTESEEVAEFLADQILRYLFGGTIECSVLVRDGTFKHKASWLPGTQYWEDIVGEVLTDSGSVEHRNESYLQWQEWEDIVGECPDGDKRSSYRVSRVSSLTFLNSIKESRWLNTDDPEDCQLYLRSRAAPMSYVQVDWNIYQRGLLPEGAERDHYEIEIVTATPFTSINYASWVTDDPRDLRLRIWSQAEGPFRWFKADWRVYAKESRQRKVIDQIPKSTLPLATSDS